MHLPDGYYNILFPSVITRMAQGVHKCQHKGFFFLSHQNIICRHSAAQVHLLGCSLFEDDSQPAREGGKCQEPREGGQQCPAAHVTRDALNKSDLGPEGRFPSLKFAVFPAEKGREAICSTPCSSMDCVGLHFPQ